jgi:serine protease Do
MRRLSWVLCLLLLGITETRADERLADLVAEVAPSVVNIYTGGVRKPRTPWEAVFGGPQRWESLGSGFVIQSDPCLIVTNQHVVGTADRIRVRAFDAREFDAEVVGADEGIDLALLLVPGCNLPSVTLGETRDLRVGEDVFAVGNPYGHGHTVTRGILSARSRSLGRARFDLFLQTDAAINPGNSGGPLFDDEGKVVGVNTAVDGRAEAIGFAMPIELLKGALPSLLKGRPVAAGWAGLKLEEQESGLLQVLEVFAGGPAEKAGVRAGDVVERVDGRALRGRSGWAESFEIAFPGDRRSLLLRRGRSRVEAALTLVARDSWAAATVGPRVKISFLRIEVQNLAADDAAQHRIDSGVQVTSVGRGSYFAPGDVLVELNGVRIKGSGDVVRAVEIAQRQRSLNAVFIRQGETRRIIQNW